MLKAAYESRLPLIKTYQCHGIIIVRVGLSNTTQALAVEVAQTLCRGEKIWFETSEGNILILGMKGQN